MSYDKILMRCERSEPNNGTVSLTLVKPSEYAMPESRQELVNASFIRARGPYEKGKDYWVEIYPA